MRFFIPTEFFVAFFSTSRKYRDSSLKLYRSRVLRYIYSLLIRPLMVKLNEPLAKNLHNFK
jgi:hypothetical protein